MRSLTDETSTAALAKAYARREDYQVSAIAIKQDIERRKQVKGEYWPRIVADISQNWDAYNGSDRSVNNWSASSGCRFPSSPEASGRLTSHREDSDHQAGLDHERTARRSRRK